MDNGYYIIIPHEIRLAPDLTPTQKLLMGEIISLSQKSGKCWASNAYWADTYNISRRSITTHIKDLEAKGYVKIDYLTKGNVTYRTMTPLIGVSEKSSQGGVKKFHGGVENISQGGMKNLLTINTRYNNTRLSIGEVTKFFLHEKSTEEVAKDFFYYYESIGWTVGKNPVQNWKALAKKWITNNKPKPKMKVLE